MAKTFLKVHFVDGSTKTVAIDKETTARELVELVAEKIELMSEIDTFSVFDVRNGVARSLKADEKPYIVMTEWQNKPNCYILFKKQFNMNPLNPPEDAVARRLIFLQTKADVLAGNYYCTVDQAIYIGALTVQINYGNHNPSVHIVGFLDKHMGDFIPSSLIKQKRNNEWEEAIFTQHAKLVGMSASECIDNYLKIAMEWSYFGDSIFPGKHVSSGMKRIGERVFLSVSHKGIALLSYPTMEQNSFYPFHDILSWGSSANTFAFTTGEQSNGIRHTFETRQGVEISSTVQGYVDLIIAEMRKNEEEEGEDEEGGEEEMEEEEGGQ